MIDKIRKVQLELLDEVVALLEKNQLVYSLEGGTLLGSIVHKGFGQFDDDIDLAMPRKDYEKLVEIVSKAKNSKFYAEEQRLVKDYHLVFMKIKMRGSNYTLNEVEQGEEIFIDIFPLDYARPYDKYIKSKRFILEKLKAIIFLKNRAIRPRDTQLKKLKQLVVKVCLPMSASLAYKLFRMIAISKESNYLINYSGKFVKRNSNSPVAINDYFPLKNSLFEGKMYKTPFKPKKVIENIYGSSGTRAYENKNKFNHI